MTNHSSHHRALTFWAPAALLGLMFLLMIGNQLHKPLAYDEFFNLRYGYRFLTQGPLAETDGQRTPLSFLNAITCIPYGCELSVLEKSELARLAVRLPAMIFALLLGVMIYRWTKELYGRYAALLSLTLYTLMPNFLAHGKQITSDVATSLFYFLSIYFFWRLMKEKRRRDFCFCALSTGAALFSKYSGILLFLVLPFLWILERGFHGKKDPATQLPEFGKSLVKGIGFCLLVLLFVNSAYLFKGSFEKTSHYNWQSQSWQRLKAFNFPVPFPRIFALGLDYTSYLDENPAFGRPDNYILGKRHRKGRWYAFPVMVLLKTPLAFFLLLGLGLLTKFSLSEKLKGSGLYLLIPFAVWLVYFSFFCDVQVGVRYVLPAFSFLIVYAGKCLAGAPNPKVAGSVGLLIGWFLLSSLSYYPHQMSYFNEFIGPRINAYKFLADSNLDWENKSYYLKKFLEKYRDLHIEINEPLKPKSGFQIVSANDYVGIFDDAGTSWIRKYEPLAHITYSHYLFYVPPAETEKILRNS